MVAVEPLLVSSGIVVFVFPAVEAKAGTLACCEGGVTVRLGVEVSNRRWKIAHPEVGGHTEVSRTENPCRMDIRT